MELDTLLLFFSALLSVIPFIICSCVSSIFGISLYKIGVIYSILINIIMLAVDASIYLFLSGGVYDSTYPAFALVFSTIFAGIAAFTTSHLIAYWGLIYMWQNFKSTKN